MATDRTVLLAATQTIANKTLTSTTLTSPVLNTAVSGTAVLDEDNMASDSATKVATQQSIKAYVDSGTVTMTNKTMTSPVLNTSVSGTAVLDEDNMASDSNTKVATQQSIKAYVDSGTVTMTNKTLTSPVLNTGVSGTAIKDEDNMASDSVSHLATQQSIKAYVDAWKSPTGSVTAFMASTPPTGWLECNGAAVSRTTYATLFGVISDDYGVGDGSTTFNLPDLRGYFLRGWDHGATNDPDAASRTDRGDGTAGDNVGTKQADDYKAHTHTYDKPTGSTSAGISGPAVQSISSAQATGTAPATGGSETRPKNINVMYIIKT